MSSSNEEEGKQVNKTDKPLTIAPEQTNNVHVYHHDWAAMQAYYGPRVALPQYYNSNVAPPGHAPPHPYMWPPPSPMMAPYGTPYPGFCPPGGVYAHPGVQMGSQSQGPTSQATPIVATPNLNMDAQAKSSGNTDHGFMKKLKEFDGLAMSISNKGGSDHEHSNDPKSSQSSENDGSSNGSDGNTTGGEQSARKRSPNTDGIEKPVTTMVNHPIMPTTTEFQNSCGMNGIVSQPRHDTHLEAWNEKDLKREKRKQSNRESARRSRLRKQAETEELSVKVDALVSENVTLRSKLSQLSDQSEKLRLENEALLEQLKKTAQTEATGNKTENLISQVDKNNSLSGTSSKNVQHKLLKASSRTDPVAAS